eukprot:8784534-Alexandrium_andersonii.AAC.1
MSASLVGSEMCIRDRLEDARSVIRSPLKARQRRDPPRSATRPAEKSESVSYTHLTLPTICSV